MSVEQELEYFGQGMTTPASPSGPPPLITDALRAMRKAVADLMLEGHPLDDILEFRPLQAQAEAWGQDRQTEDGFVGTIYESVTAR
jgi:hypothetical protein